MSIILCNNCESYVDTDFAGDYVDQFGEFYCRECYFDPELFDDAGRLREAPVSSIEPKPSTGTTLTTKAPEGANHDA